MILKWHHLKLTLSYRLFLVNDNFKVNTEIEQYVPILLYTNIRLYISVHVSAKAVKMSIPLFHGPILQSTNNNRLNNKAALQGISSRNEPMNLRNGWYVTVRHDTTLLYSPLGERDTYIVGSQKIVLFITTAVRTSNPTYSVPVPYYVIVSLLSPRRHWVWPARWCISTGNMWEDTISDS
jgi:hypothetical protein